MPDTPAAMQAARALWSQTRVHTDRLTLWSGHHPFVALGLLYGVLAYLGVAVLTGMAGPAILGLIVVGPAAWWCFGRYVARTDAQPSKLGFFTWDNGPLCLSEDLSASKLVYCIGLRNEGVKAIKSVCVNAESVEGHPQVAGAPLPVFRNSDRSIDLQPGEAEYFCIMRRIDGTSDRAGGVTLCCQDEGSIRGFALGELAGGRTMTLSACGDGAPRIATRIVISASNEANAAWPLQVKLLPDVDTPASVASTEPAPTPAPKSAPAAPGPAPARVVKRTPPASPPRVEEAPVQSERVRRLLAGHRG